MQKICNNVSRLQIVFLGYLMKVEDCVVTALLPLLLFEMEEKKVLFVPVT